MRKLFLNVGGGSKATPIPPYYAQFEHHLLDIDPAKSPDLLMDGRDLALVAAGSYDAVYCSHNLEHYFHHDVPKVLGGFFHVLRDGGFAEIRVPDLGLLIRTMAKQDLDIEDTIYVAPAGPISARDMFYGFAAEIERSGLDFYAHKTGFTAKSLARQILAAGFPLAIVGAGRSWELLGFGFRSEPDDALKDMLGIAGWGTTSRAADA
jgi:SAM-dependent methyltransferase